MEDLLALIDEWLALTIERELFASSECADRLLDMRKVAVKEPALT